jgi:hypothetical protein
MLRRLALISTGSLALAAAAAPAAIADRADLQSTVAITDGNGDSTDPVVSQDRRYSTVLAFESTASDLVAGDTNGAKDIFMVRRAGRADNNGSEWNPGPTTLVSRGLGGEPANGPSWHAAIDGGFPQPAGKPTYPKCIAFLSDASNLGGGAHNRGSDDGSSSGPGGELGRV